MKAIFFIFGCSGSSLLHTGFLQLQLRGLLSSCTLASLVAEPTLEALGRQQLWRTGLVAPWHVASSQTRDQTCVPCTGTQIFICCVTREVRDFIFNYHPPKKKIIQNGNQNLENSASCVSCTLSFSRNTSTSVNWKGGGSIVIKCYIFKENYFRSNNWVLLAHSFVTTFFDC